MGGLRWKRKRGSIPPPCPVGAGDGFRTRDLKLGKLALYQLSYARIQMKRIAKARGAVNGRPAP